MFHRGAAYVGAGAFGLLAYAQAGCDSVKEAKDEPLLSAKNLPPRAHMHSALKRATATEPLDVLIIGGGASGTGTALDATTRGLSTALIERDDFGSGTSCRSTKLIHGGVRYLEKAFFKLDYSQLKLVFEALKERRIMLDIAPHLSSKLPIMTVRSHPLTHRYAEALDIQYTAPEAVQRTMTKAPCYEWWEVPYYWAGLKAYDLVANFGNLAMSAYLTPSESLRKFPTLSETRADGATLKGTIEYYDGQFDDSRYALALAQTAALHGATVLNHATATALIKDKDDKVIGAKIKDNETGTIINVHAKVVVNATGPFTDAVRQMADGKAEDIIMPSAGVHVTLPDYYSPDAVGMIVPKTKDGRVVFMLPWEGATIAGTTDSPSPITHVPQAKEEDVQFILTAIEDYLDVQVRREDVQSVWCGIRPLAKDPSATDTADAVREHLVIAEKNGMVTVTGGKWTTYRLMAEDTVDAVIEAGNLATERGCVTERLPLVGAEKYSTSLFAHLAQAYKVPHRTGHINIDIARRLTAAYGDQATHVTEIAQNERLSRRLVPWHDIIEAEVVYAARHEMCCGAVDFLARRSRLAFLDVAAARQALPRVIELLGKELKWSSFGWRYKQEMKAAEEFLKTFEPEKGK